MVLGFSGMPGIPGSPASLVSPAFLAIPTRIQGSWSDACEVGGGAVISLGGAWWAAWWDWPPALTGEIMFFLEGRALLRALEFAIDLTVGLQSPSFLIRCDNLPFVQAAQRGCSSTRLGNTLIGNLDVMVERVPDVAVEWVSTEVMLADPFSRVPLGARPPGAGKSGDLVALDLPPLDPHGCPPPEDCGRPGEGAKMLRTGALLAV